MTRSRTDNETQEEIWYLDLCASRNIYNNKKRFADLQSKNNEFVTTGGDFIRSEEVETIRLPLQNGFELTLYNVVSALNKIQASSLGELRESGISYHDHPKSMILILKARKQHPWLGAEAKEPLHVRHKARAGWTTHDLQRKKTTYLQPQSKPTSEALALMPGPCQQRQGHQIIKTS